MTTQDRNKKIWITTLYMNMYQNFQSHRIMNGVEFLYSVLFW